MQKTSRKKFDEFISRPTQYETLITQSKKIASTKLGGFGNPERDGQDALLKGITTLLEKIDSEDFILEEISRNDAIKAIASQSRVKIKASSNGVLVKGNVNLKQITEEDIANKIAEKEAAIFAKWLRDFMGHYLYERYKRRTIKTPSAHVVEDTKSSKKKIPRESRFFTLDDNECKSVCLSDDQVESIRDPKSHITQLLSKLEVKKKHFTTIEMYLGDYTYKEIASVVGVTEKAVGQRVRRFLADQKISKEELMNRDTP
ncbi:hypothetical protein DBZ36_01130 [Alginatibacterium sediminis]|uniref:RNA polymerase sigma factor 70 region 4 type 2 domain-containing protein n=1 Tax=Alginatibacterium sediminis TaxID=2164068 RepID=A0A420ENL8_9ALTE|nr:sigma-70 region 4 domain-containing protein [Alginatibacterium sediminis]RKF22280.1 hypothetical protein DBZ36_01130 [Alginatibacterium sediminis]